MVRGDRKTDWAGCNDVMYRQTGNRDGDTYTGRHRVQDDEKGYITHGRSKIKCRKHIMNT